MKRRVYIVILLETKKLRKNNILISFSKKRMTIMTIMTIEQEKKDGMLGQNYKGNGCLIIHLGLTSLQLDIKSTSRVVFKLYHIDVVEIY